MLTATQEPRVDFGCRRILAAFPLLAEARSLSVCDCVRCVKHGRANPSSNSVKRRIWKCP
jgi:hypothetical protein